jgi:predicted nucleotide-binding protein (sugar kinase/HSP70/actin superfamily)
VVYYLYWKGKRYYKQKKLIQRIESLKPKLMWTVIQPYASDTLRPVNVSPTSNNIYEKVVDVIEKSLRPSTQPVLKKITSKTSRPSYGVQILMSQEVVPDVQVYLLDELKRKGLTNDSLIKAAPKSSSRVVLPILV